MEEPDDPLVEEEPDNIIHMPGQEDKLTKPPSKDVSLRIDPKDILLFGM